VETILKDFSKQILSSDDFKKNFTDSVKGQPLSLYKWTNNKHLPSLGEIRQRYLKNLKNLVTSQYGDSSSEMRSKRGKSIMEMKSTHSKINSSQINMTRQNMSKDQTVIKEEYNEVLENDIQERYFKDLLVKYKYTIKEVNECIIITNDETKKLISDMIMENTLYNIICETVYGEIDLTVKPRIYFFLGKGNNINPSESGNLGGTETKNENQLLKSDNSENNKNNEEANKIEEEKVNPEIKEENKNNVSSGSNKSKNVAPKNN
jgi:hypothetical protein